MHSANRSLKLTFRHALHRTGWVHPPVDERAPADPFWAHVYYTDGTRLYRLVGSLNRSVNGVVAEFEDCASMDIVLMLIDEMTSTRMWPLLSAEH